MVSNEFSQVETEFKQIFRLLKTTADPRERSLLLQDCDMLLKLAARLIKASDHNVSAIRKKARTRRLDSLHQRVLDCAAVPAA